MSVTMKQLMAWEAVRKEHGEPSPIPGSMWYTLNGSVLLIHQRTRPPSMQRGPGFLSFLVGHEDEPDIYRSTVVKLGDNIEVPGATVEPGSGVALDLDGTAHDWQTRLPVYGFSLMRPLSPGEIGFLFSAAQPQPRTGDPRGDHPWRY